MALVLNWEPPFPAPENVTISLVDGGNLSPNTTYYYRISAASRFDFYGAYRTGAPSVEVSITTTDTQRSIALSWDAVSEAEGYCVYRRTTQPNYDFYGSFIRNENGNIGYPTTYTTSFTDDGTRSTYAPNHAIWPHSKTIPVLDHTLGQGYFGISGDGTLTLDDIYNTIGNSNYCYYDGHYFVLLGYLYFEYSGGQITFEVKEKVIDIIGNIFSYNNNPDTLIAFGEYDSSTGATRRGCFLRLWDHFLSYDYRGKMRFYNTKMVSVNSSAGSELASWALATAGWKIRSSADIEFKNSDCSEFLVGGYMRDFNFDGGWRYNFGGYYPKSYGYWDITQQKNFSCKILDLLTTHIRDLSGVTVYGDAPWGKFYHIRLSQGADVHPILLNCHFPNSGDLPYMFWYGGTALSSLTLRYSLDIKVTTKDGTPIEGATVTIKDVNDNIVAETTTDANGDITQQKLNWVVLQTTTTAQHYSIEHPEWTTYTYYTPHTVTISKDGYQTKTITYTMDRKMEEIVVLEPAVKFLLPMGEKVYKNLKPADGQNKVLWTEV